MTLYEITFLEGEDHLKKSTAPSIDQYLKQRSLMRLLRLPSNFYFFLEARLISNYASPITHIYT
jgi:hypothetical protein